MELENIKRSFIAHNNTTRDREGASRAAVNAASQRNLLYAKRGSSHAVVRGFWIGRLEQYGTKYAKGASISTFEMDIQTLCKEMNDNFSLQFHPGNEHYERGFRVSHAQKSLSVYLKHLWCLDEIPTPPVCPVDSFILRKAGLRYPQTRWAHVNLLEEYREQLAVLQERADEAGLSLAEWELRTWSV